MSLNEENITLFDLYLRGELNNGEKADFEERLSSDEEFNKKYELYRLSMDTIETFNIGQHMGNIVDRERRRKKNTWLIPAAAAAIILITTPIIYFNFFRPTTNQELYIAYYSPYPADQNVRGGGQSDQAMTLYRTEKYTEAIPIFESIVTSNNSSPRIHLFLGNCYLNTSNLSKAIENFKMSSDINSKIITQNGEWYLALAYLKQGNRKNARAQLEFIISTNHLFKEKAGKLLNELG